MASPNNLRELRYYSSSTFNSGAFTDASSAKWDPSANTDIIKLRTTAYDDSGIEHQSEPDPTLQVNVYGRPANLTTIQAGTFTFSTFVGARYAGANTDSPPIATLLSKLCGELDAATADDAIEAASTSTVLNLTGHSIGKGQAVMVGTRGDARGNAEIREVLDTTANTVTLNMALSAAPSASDVVRIATTVSLNDAATQEYQDFLAIGHASNDQRQMFGCVGSFELAAASTSELPQFNFTMTPAQHQWVPDGELDAFQPATAAEGRNPPIDRGLGGFFLQDNGTTTRAVLKGGNIELPAFLNFIPVPDLNGINGIGGFQVAPPENGIVCSFTLLFDEDMDGLHADYIASTGGTAKQLLVQYGNEAGKCFAFSIPKGFIDVAPVPEDMNGLRAVRVTMHAEDQSDLGGDSRSQSAIRFHWF
jgi:hypothetical protein